MKISLDWYRSRPRYLCLPPPLGPGKMPDESPEELNRKHLRNALQIGSATIHGALSPELQANLDRHWNKL